MRQPNPRNWSNENGAAPITADATPAAAVDMLVMADAYPVDVATTPYCGTGRLFKGCVDTTERYLAFMVAPGALNARAAFIRPEFNAGTDTGKNNTSWTGTGGTTPPDTIQTADPLATTDPSGAGGGVSWSYQYGWGSTPITTGLLVDDAPTQVEDRQYTLAHLGHPYVETAYFTYTGSLAIWISQQRADLETL